MLQASSTSVKPLVLLVALILLGAGPQDSEEKKDDPGKKPVEEQEKFNQEQRKAILELFTATKKTLSRGGKLRLEYVFSTEADDALVADWTPQVQSVQAPIRWAGRYEGWVYQGVMLADKGTWLHKGMWAKDLTMDVECRSYAQTGRGDYLVAAIFDAKGKRALGSNFGKQLVTLGGLRIAKVVPKTFPVAPAEKLIKFGFTVKDGTFIARRNSRDTKLSGSHKKFKAFRAGFRWKGRVQANIHTVVLEGTLDEGWLLKKI